eukprot:scaffold5048_cov338-Prasinococcus_capsulatus_cf.AAC.13
MALFSFQPLQLPHPLHEPQPLAPVELRHAAPALLQVGVMQQRLRRVQICASRTAHLQQARLFAPRVADHGVERGLRVRATKVAGSAAASCRPSLGLRTWHAGICAAASTSSSRAHASSSGVHRAPSSRTPFPPGSCRLACGRTCAKCRCNPRGAGRGRRPLARHASSSSGSGRQPNGGTLRVQPSGMSPREVASIRTHDEQVVDRLHERLENVRACEGAVAGLLLRARRCVATLHHLSQAEALLQLACATSRHRRGAYVASERDAHERAPAQTQACVSQWTAGAAAASTGSTLEVPWPGRYPRRCPARSLCRRSRSAAPATLSRTFPHPEAHSA